MKKTILILVALIATLGFFTFYLNESKAKDRGGRCTGSASCSACKNCSRCAHCSNGGTCGVCSGSSGGSSYNTNYSTHSSNNSTYKTTSSSSHKTSTHKKTTTKKSNHFVVRSYVVKTAILNIRKEPTKLSEVLCVVKKKHKIKILKSHNEFWYLVEATCGGKRIKGFVTKGSLI